MQRYKISSISPMPCPSRLAAFPRRALLLWTASACSGSQATTAAPLVLVYTVVQRRSRCAAHALPESTEARGSSADSSRSGAEPFPQRHAASEVRKERAGLAGSVVDQWGGGGRGRGSSAQGPGRGRGRGSSAPPTSKGAAAAEQEGRAQQGGSASNGAAGEELQGPGRGRSRSAPPVREAASGGAQSEGPSSVGSAAAGKGSGQVYGRGRGRGTSPGGRAGARAGRWVGERNSGTAAAQGATAHVSRGGSGSAVVPIDAPLLTSLIKNSTSVASLMQLVERHQNSRTFDHIHAGAVLSTFTKLVQWERFPKAHGRAYVEQLVALSKRHLATAKPRQLVNMLHSVAKLQGEAQLGPADPVFVQQLVTGIQSKVSECNSQNLSNSLWAVATLFGDQHSCGQFVEVLLREAEGRLSEFNAQDLSNSLWAIATLPGGNQHSHSQFIHAWVKETAGRLSDFKPQELSNSLWGLATLCGEQHSHSQFIHAWVKETAGRLSGFKPQELSNSLWALATLCGDQHSHSQFILAWVKEAAGRLSGFTPQDLSNSLWALATLCGQQHSHSQFIHAWVKEAAGRLSDFNSQALSNSLWALAKLRHTDYSFTARLLQAARALLPYFKPQEISNTAYALGTLRYKDPDFMRQLIQHARAKLLGFTPQELANILWAMAWLNHNDAAFVNEAVQRLLQHRHSMSMQDLSNTLWALSILDHNSAAVLQALLAEAEAALLHGATDSVGHRQAFQYLVTMEGRGHISPQLKEQHRELWEVCQAARAEQLQRTARSSLTQQQVLEAVRQLPGCSGAQCEQLTDDGLLSIDVALQLPDGTKVAVEVDGPTHFMCNAPDVPDGSTVWRNLMLQRRGWVLVSVPAVEWSSVDCDAMKQRAYLLQRLAEAGVQLPCEGEEAPATAKSAKPSKSNSRAAARRSTSVRVGAAPADATSATKQVPSGDATDATTSGKPPMRRRKVIHL